MSMAKRTAWLALAIAAALAAAPANAAPYSTIAAGNWTAEATWSGTGYPVSGDNVTIGHNLTVTGEQAFGDPSTQSVRNAGNIVISGSSDKLTLAANSIFRNAAVGDLQIDGAGTFINLGTVDHNAGGWLFFGVNSAPTFRNQGVVEVSSTGTFATHGSSTFLNESGGAIQRTASGLGSFIARSNAVAPVFEAQSGSILKAVASDSQLRFTMPAVATASVNGASFQGDGQIQFNGYWSQIAGTVSGNARVELAGGVHVVPTGGTIYNVTGSSKGLEWTNNDITLNGNATNQGIFSIKNGLSLNGSGEFINAQGGTVRYDDNGAHSTTFLSVTGGPTTFRNQGTFVFADAGYTDIIQTHNTEGRFINDTTGVLRMDVVGKGRIEKRIGVTADGWFNNLGTVEVTAGEIEIGNTLLSTSASGTALTEGTWRVQAGANNAEIDLQLATSGIATIGSGAVVVLSETGAGGTATFSQINGLSTVQGTFLVNGSKNFTSTASGITVDGGTIGGSGTISETVTVTGGTITPGASAGSLEVGGALTLDDDSTVRIEVGGTTFTLNGIEQYDRVKVSGLTTLGGTLDIAMLDGFVPADGDLFGIFDATGGLSGAFSGLPEGAEVWNNGEKLYMYITYQGLVGDTTVALAGGNDVVLYALQIPEPTSLALLAAGGLLCLRRRRR